MQTALKWILQNAIIDVKDFNRMPMSVKHAAHHIHESGVCKKNRAGTFCPVDTVVHV